jgi:hypothetical protein
MESIPPQGAGLTSLKPVLEFLANTTVLVVLMGVPATIHQYSMFHVPIVFLSYRRVLVAGIVPAILTALFVAYLLWVEKRLSPSGDSVIVDTSGEYVGRRTASTTSFLALPAMPFVFPGALALILGFIGMPLVFP